MNTIDDILRHSFRESSLEEKLEIKRLGFESSPGTQSLDTAGGPRPPANCGLSMFIECHQDETTEKLKNISLEISTLKKSVLNLQHAVRKLKQRSCPAGYIRFKTSCLKFVMSDELKKNWYDAEQFCLSEGGHLLTVDYHDKKRFVNRYMQKNLKAHFLRREDVLLYTGLIYTDKKSRIPFDLGVHWVNQYSYADAFRWTATQLKPGEHKTYKPKTTLSIESPDKFLSCAMLELVQKGRKYKLYWRTHTCDEKHYFICDVRFP
ncbi:macrophage mannose receptor 1 [Plakobranchus ocellatus]|uniref:Macrophage mannose receptor 1 n=1 Tax=Plakobranchus ocellatus TaxID=259542 RepID=A0AAV4AED4_9GAST|nr:macrophage mannose receptor 1 [Plakobranchus ocellatus]